MFLLKVLGLLTNHFNNKNTIKDLFICHFYLLSTFFKILNITSFKSFLGISMSKLLKLLQEC